MDRRALFFAAAAAACALLTTVAPEEYRKVAFVVSAVYIVLAILSALDAASRGRGGRRR